MGGKEKEGREREEGGEGEKGGGREREGREGEKGVDVEGPGKWSAPGPAMALGGPATISNYCALFVGSYACFNDVGRLGSGVRTIFPNFPAAFCPTAANGEAMRLRGSWSGEC